MQSKYDVGAWIVRGHYYNAHAVRNEILSPAGLAGIVMFLAITFVPIRVRGEPSIWASPDMIAAQRLTMEAYRKSGIPGILAPGSPIPKIGGRATILEYLRWAKFELCLGKFAEAELSTEWADLLNRVADISAALAEQRNTPLHDAFCEKALCVAMRDIGELNRREGIRDLDKAIEQLTGLPEPFVLSCM